VSRPDAAASENSRTATDLWYLRGMARATAPAAPRPFASIGASLRAMAGVACALGLLAGPARAEDPVRADDAVRLDVEVGETVDRDVGFAMGLLCDDLAIVRAELHAATSASNTFSVTGVAEGTTRCRVGTAPNRPTYVFEIHVVPPHHRRNSNRGEHVLDGVGWAGHAASDVRRVKLCRGTEAQLGRKDGEAWAELFNAREDLAAAPVRWPGWGLLRARGA
jgi:hypothetical protein